MIFPVSVLRDSQWGFTIFHCAFRAGREKSGGRSKRAPSEGGYPDKCVASVLSLLPVILSENLSPY